MKYKVLYAEDEPFLATIVSDGLRSSGYDVLWAEDGQAALDMISDFKPDICVLDIMMPLKDGYTLAEDIRKMHLKVPIIFLSARSHADDVILGFRSGGNDYLKKPFSMGELIVRMESLLARFEEQKEERNRKDLLDFGSCTLDTKNQVLKCSAGNVDLSFKEMALLELLIVNRNNVLERQQALLKIWGDDTHYNSRSMDVFMANIRKLLKNEPEV
jgi:DNA-binding response OmpR family regulator